MNLYEFAVMQLGNVFILVTLVFLGVAAHGWAMGRLLVYAVHKGTPALWWVAWWFVLLSMLGVTLRGMVIFTDQAPPLRLVDLLEYGSLFGLVLTIAWYVQTQILKAGTYKRRMTDDLNHT